MTKWVRMQLNRGRYGEGLQQRLFSDKVLHEMVTAHHRLHAYGNSTGFLQYTMAMEVVGSSGRQRLQTNSHTGGLGMVT